MHSCFDFTKVKTLTSWFPVQFLSLVGLDSLRREQGDDAVDHASHSDKEGYDRADCLHDEDVVADH